MTWLELPVFLRNAWNYPGWWIRYSPAPDYAGRQQADAACIRQAHDLLSALNSHDGWH